ncbi:glycosyltransferase family 2 protein [Neobacillus niacini]|uniref:glycosyltransferase family 2 protein n=1 Tax=Neobacillus niacini TaxID=86668 RepID=UPI0021CB4BC2|nr:glycosyltransferase family 2 protein [Neobacillus niacini]MCM3763933.1 glycosyltransferase family 2 protein [Neobacillus niacini]
MSKCKITVFTATYNREHTLTRLYQSLQKQTFRDFEWVIVDDGSTDNTEELINNYKSDEINSFTIKYIKQQRGGKHRAINKGLDIADGELFFLVDSDDYITENALEKIILWEKSINNKSEYSGLSGLSGYDVNASIGTTFKGNFKDMKVTEQFSSGITGDRANIFYTNIFRKYKYPTFEGEWHIAPGVPYIRMAKDGYKMRYFNEIIYIAEYLEDGLTNMGDKKILENFKGYTLRSKELLQTEIPLKRKMEVIGKYTYLGRKNNLDYSEVAQGLKINVILAFLLGNLAKIYFIVKGK